jgi:hypothetical protein
MYFRHSTSQLTHKQGNVNYFESLRNIASRRYQPNGNGSNESAENNVEEEYAVNDSELVIMLFLHYICDVTGRATNALTNLEYFR